MLGLRLGLWYIIRSKIHDDKCTIVDFFSRSNDLELKIATILKTIPFSNNHAFMDIGNRQLILSLLK